MAKTTDELTADDKFELLIQALVQKQEQGLSKEMLQELLANNATAMQKALKPENETHPGYSVFSHPEGDRAKPKPPLPYQLFWNNYPVYKFPETETWADWELYAQLEPGSFTVIRKDGTPMTVTIEGERDGKQQLSRVLVTMPISREEKWLVPPTYVTLYQLVHRDNPKKRFVEAMQHWYAMVMAEDTVPA